MHQHDCLIYLFYKLICIKIILDIIYFVLPSLTQQNSTIYGISCYRQIAADAALRQLDANVTRSSVQKSVCVLSKVPLYGVLRGKLELITQAYFNEKNFSKVKIKFINNNEQKIKSFLNFFRQTFQFKCIKIYVIFSIQIIQIFKQFIQVHIVI